MDSYMLASLLALLVVAGADGRLLQQNMVQFVPQGCQGLTVAVTGSYGYSDGGNPIVSGSVTLSNPNTFDMPISNVKVQVSNNIPVAPIFVTASCSSPVVPANPIPYQLGTTICTYVASLPTNGIASGFNSWPSVMATATVGLSNAQCASSVTPIAGGQPVLMAGSSSSGGGRKLFSATKAVSGRELQQNMVQFVPQGCQGLTVDAFAHFEGHHSHKDVAGKVLLQNPNQFDIPITQVQVTIANNVVVAPITVTATCFGSVVRANPVPYTKGVLLCTFKAQLPTSGPAAHESAWTSVEATATIGLSNAQCSSSISTIKQPLMG